MKSILLKPTAWAAGKPGRTSVRGRKRRNTSVNAQDARMAANKENDTKKPLFPIKYQVNNSG